MILTSQHIQQIYRIKKSLADSWIPLINQACTFAEINTKMRISAFVAQIGHESGCLRYTREIWGPTDQQLRYDGTSLAKRLGNIEPGDGQRYLGRGLIQTTGRTNYALTRDKLRRSLDDTVPDFVAFPELLQQPVWAAMSAGLFWKEKNLNKFADSGNFSELTRRINGGYNGMAHRQALYTAALASII